MPKQRFPDYRDELAHQRSVWQRKASLRIVYRHWYGRIVAELSSNQPTIEIGAGSGNFKEFAPEVIATDALKVGDWIDEVVDARFLPYNAASIGNFVLVDVLHHLQRPLDFLRAASDALTPGGRIVILEPAATPWARLVLGVCHHEPLDLSLDIIGEDGTPEPPNDDFSYANQATASILFERNVEATMALLPGLRLADVQRSDFLVYPMTGGFSYLNFLPKAFVEPLLKLEARLPARLRRVVAMRMLIVLERTDGHPVSPGD